MTIKSKARRKWAFTIIFLSKEAPDLLGSFLRGIFIIWKVLHVLRIDHFENCLHQMKRNNASEGAVEPGSPGKTHVADPATSTTEVTMKIPRLQPALLNQSSREEAKASVF